MTICRTCAVLAVVWMTALCTVVQAQKVNSIRLRLLDGKTGRIVTGAGILVYANHDSTAHGEWVKTNEDETTNIQVPRSVAELLVHATYDYATEYYVNCDGPKALDTPSEMWYKVSNIITSGVVAPDGCIKPKEFEKLDISAKPGELVLFVRKESWRDRAHEMTQ